MVAQKNHQITKYATENKWHGDLFTNRENLTAKTPPGDFQVTTPEIPLLSQQTITSKRIPIPYTNLQLNLYPIPNWTCSVVTISLFDARLSSTWLTNAWIPVRNFNHQLEKVAGCKVLQFIPTMKIKKMLGQKTLQCTYTATSLQEWWTRAKLCLRLQIAWTTLCLTLMQLVYLLMTLKIIILYV